MERIRKWMTIMAIAGTVFVTAVFCYMPFREMIKENRKNTISIEQENTLGSVENDAGELKENLAETIEKIEEEIEEIEEELGKAEGSKGESETEKETAAVLQEERQGTDAVVFQIKRDGQKLRISLWQSKEGICYVFLPGFAKEESIQVESIEGNGTFTIGSRRFQDGDRIQGIAWEEAYEFTLYDKKKEQVFSAPLIFLHSSDLPVLSVSTESESMEWIHEEKGNEEAGEILLFDEEGNCCYQGEAESISGRGNSTWGLLKKPYQLKLKEKADLLGLGSAGSFNLLADGYDETKLRNQIVFGLAQELGMPYTPQGQSVDLYCNGVYYGVYYLCEKIQIGEAGVAITDMEENSSVVYDDLEAQKLQVITSEDGMRKWTDCQVEEKDITGGYLFEREIPYRYEEEISGFITDQGDAYALQSPKYATEAQVNYIADKMQEFQDAAEEKDGVNKKTGKHYSEYIDVESFVQKYLIEEVTKNYDGAVTSSFFYKPADSESTKIYAGPVWDYDVAFGNCNLDEIVSDPMGITMLNDHVLGTGLFADLYQKEEFYRQVTALYEQKALPYLEELLEGGIDALSEKTKQAVRLDRIRWEELENRYRYYDSYENDIAYLKYYINARKNFLNDVWLLGVEYHSVTFLVDGEPWKRVYVKDAETAGAGPIPAKSGAFFCGWRREENNVPYDEYKPVYEDMVFYPIWQELSEKEEEAFETEDAS